jgi:hypothetical protein
MELSTYEYRDPSRLIWQLARRVQLSAGMVYVVLVARPSTEQRIVTTRALDLPALIGDYQEACEELQNVMRLLPIPAGPPPPDHSVETVLVRPGLCVFGPNESRWMEAWRYSNHLTNAFVGDLILVTEHGWCDFMTYEAGHSPALVA